MVDGVAFSTASASANANISAKLGYHGNSPSIILTASDGNADTVKNLGFGIDAFRPNTYDLDTTTLIIGGITAGYWKQTNSTFEGVGIFSSGKGMFTLTQIDSTTHRLSATFNFSEFDTTNKKTIHVTNGVIDNVRWVVE